MNCGMRIRIRELEQAESGGPRIRWVARLGAADVAEVSLWTDEVPSWRGRPLAFLGRYRCDPGGDDAGDAVLRAAVDRAHRGGAAGVIAPIDGSTWASYRLVTWLGSEPAFPMEPWTPESWPGQFEAAGFVPLARYLSTICDDPAGRDPRLSSVRERLIRLGLLAVIAAHIYFTIQLTLENRRARPVKYAVSGCRASTSASRTMIVSGLILLCFIVFHLLHYTAHKIDPSFADLHDAKGRHDVYRMIILGFKNVWASGFYLLGVFLLCQHMGHGIVSFAQTLGVKTGGLSRFWIK